MFKRLLLTSDDPALLILRIILGIVFFAHGAQKALGWFGGDGLQATMESFTSKMNIPTPLAALAIAAEFLGGLGLITGLLARIAALGILTNMVVAIFMVHLKNGFFMNWFGKQPGEGFEYHLLAIAMALAIVLNWAGSLSLDRVIARDA